MRNETPFRHFNFRRRISIGPAELALLAIVSAIVGAMAVDFGLAARHTHQLERAVYAGLAEAASEDDSATLNLSQVRDAAITYLGLDGETLPKGTMVSATETCSCQNGLIETVQGMCPAQCEGTQAIERKYVRVTFTQSHDWLLAGSLMGQSKSLTVTRAMRVR